MFTGLIEEIGTVQEAQHHDGSTRLIIGCKTVLENTNLGDSIAVNGCCLTVTDLTADSFSALATPETLSLTNIGQLKSGAPVNLERSVTLTTRLGGHMVQGHVDSTGEVLLIQPEGDSQRWTFTVQPELRKYLVKKGSVAVNGVSLTVADLSPETFSVALIPKTLELTTFGTMKPGDPVNLEADVIGKYVYTYMNAASDDNQ